jgi:aminoglycoside phosphotransferase (APT) family kinase protein
MASDDLADQLAAVLHVAEVTDLVRLSGGASRDTFRLVADGRPLILQRQRPGAERDMAVEVAALRAARQAGVPVADVVASSLDASVLGAPFMVLSAIDGETIARKILRDDAFVEARAALPVQFANALAALHRVPADQVPGLEAPDQLAMYRDVLDGFGHPHPAFELAFRWLHDHRPPLGDVAVVHGDFRLGNVIVGPEGLRAVLDWELSHLGDPMEDLGWLCVKAWRFGSSLPVAGVGEYEELLDAYAAATGKPIDVDVVRWWEVFGTLKWGIICIMQASSHLLGLTRSHELAAIGRRVCENEYDLFLALDGRW